MRKEKSLIEISKDQAVNKKAFLTMEEVNWLSIQNEKLDSNRLILFSIAKETISLLPNLSLENIVTFLLSDKTLLSTKDDSGMYLIHWAAYTNNIKLMALLLSYNVNINVRNVKGLTPLHFAAQLNYSELTNYLLKNKANPTLIDANGYTPADYANYYKHSKLHTFLTVMDYIEKKQDIIELKDSYNITHFYNQNKQSINEVINSRSKYL